MDTTRANEIRQKIEDHVATFKVGDMIVFYLYTEGEEIEMDGVIRLILGHTATVEHMYGTCFTNLTTAKHKLPNA